VFTCAGFRSDPGIDGNATNRDEKPTLKKGNNGGEKGNDGGKKGRGLPIANNADAVSVVHAVSIVMLATSTTIHIFSR